MIIHVLNVCLYSSGVPPVINVRICLFYVTREQNFTVLSNCGGFSAGASASDELFVVCMTPLQLRPNLVKETLAGPLNED